MSSILALIVVDMQNDFCPPDGSLAVGGARDIIPGINKLLGSDKFVVKIATKDWHPTDHVSFAANHPPPNNKPLESYIDIQNHVADKPEETMKQRLWPTHCVQNSKGAEFVDGLDASKVDLTVKKGQNTNVEMYSAFTDSFGNLTHGQGGVSHDLAQQLHARKVSDVFVVGVAGDYCVKFTALGAAKAGFTTYLIEDAQRSVDPEQWSAVTKELEEGGVTLVSMAGDKVQSLL